MAVEWICHICTANWSQDEFTAGCDECGGGAMRRPCIICGGRCGKVWDRMPMDSQDFQQAHWTGSCGLPKSEQMLLMREQLESEQSNSE